MSDIESVVSVTLSLRRETVKVTDTEQYKEEKEITVVVPDPEGEEGATKEEQRAVMETKTRTIERDVEKVSYVPVVTELSPAQVDQMVQNKYGSKEAAAAEVIHSIRQKALAVVLDRLVSDEVAGQVAAIDAMVSDEGVSVADILAVLNDAAK